MLRLTLFAIVILTTTAFAATDQWNKDYKVGANPSLRVETNDGRVHVKAIAGSQISANVQTTGYKIGNDDVRITERQNGDAVELIVKLVRHMNFVGFGNHSIEINLTVPPSTKLDVRSSDGSLEVLGVRAPATLATSDGRIDVSDFDGALNAHTSDGSIRVNGRFDDLQLGTSDGRIEADVRPGSKMSNAWRIHTSDGSIHLRLPGEFSADVDVRTSDGSVNSELPILVNGSIRKNALRGRLNAGGQLLEVRTTDGSIRLQRY